jgi:diguanylate cyclase
MSMEILPLRNTGLAADCARLPVASQLVECFTAIIESAEPGPDYDPILGELKQRGGAFAQATGREAIASTSHPLVSTCREAVKAVRQRQQARRQDIASLVGLVRDAVGSLVQGQAESSEALGASTTRLEHLQNVDNFFELKQQLAEEVITLRKIAADREQEHARAIRTLEAKLRASEGQLSAARTEALTDPLTEVANRRGFDLALAQAITISAPTTPVVLALIDIDAFKEINDVHGHPTGDAVLRDVAAAIRDSIREEDVVARIGGDEFALIAAGLPLAQATARLKHIVATLAARTYGEGAKLSVSCGVCEYSAGDTLATLMQRADVALNAAKSGGKNRVVAGKVPYIHSLLRALR